MKVWVQDLGALGLGLRILGLGFKLGGLGFGIECI